MTRDESGIDRAGEPGIGPAVEAVEEVLRDGYFDGMYRRLAASFDNVPSQAIEDALLEAIARCVKLPEAPDNVRAWLMRVARNLLIDVARRLKSKPHQPYDPEVDVRGVPSAEEEALADETYRAVVKHVQQWEQAKMRTVVLVVLEAVHDRIDLPSPDLAERVGELLGESVTVHSVEVAKSRGMKKLRSEYLDIFPTS